MIRQVLYVAAPLRPTEEEIAAVKAIHGQTADHPTSQLRLRQALEANLDRAMRWLAWLRRSFPETTFIAPWIASVLAGADDADDAQRAAGMADACAVVERCDGIVLCGGRISEGMRREMEHGVRMTYQRLDTPMFQVYVLTKLGAEPPAYERDPVTTMEFELWVRIGMQQYEATR
jgi:hypothetical protein